MLEIDARCAIEVALAGTMEMVRKGYFYPWIIHICASHSQISNSDYTIIPMCSMGGYCTFVAIIAKGI
jgi:hypothetical protein